MAGFEEDSTLNRHTNRRRSNFVAVDSKRHCEAREDEARDVQKRSGQEAEGQEEETEMMKRAALYCRVSTGDQNLETQLLDLRGIMRGLLTAPTSILERPDELVGRFL